ncbi:MAG: hypothetical protein ACRC1K_19725, partial [Planctomycetia bacterium]
TWAETDRLSLLHVHDVFWVLLCSGAALVVLLAGLRQPPGEQWRWFATAGLGATAVSTLVPNSAAWLWLGGQWGVLLAVSAGIGRALGRRKQRRLERRRRTSTQESARRNAATASSLLRRLRPDPTPPPAERAPAFAAPGPTNLGSTAGYRD